MKSITLFYKRQFYLHKNRKHFITLLSIWRINNITSLSDENLVSHFFILFRNKKKLNNFFKTDHFYLKFRYVIHYFATINANMVQFIKHTGFAWKWTYSFFVVNFRTQNSRYVRYIVLSLNILELWSTLYNIRGFWINLKWYPI